MDVSLVITCWNGKELLKRNLPEIYKAAGNPRNKIKEILIVDDGSTDNSVEFIESFKDAKFQSFKLKLVKHEKNLGYSATCNTGVREAKGELVVILNLDVIPSNNFLEEALPHFKEEKVFAVTFNEGKFGPGKLGWKNGFLEIEPIEIPKSTSTTDWPNGGSSIFRRRIWEEIGGMDEIFLPFYFEDIDLGIRARKLGYKCLWEPKAKIKHEHEATINPQNFDPKYIDLIKQRNHLLLTWRNLSSPKLFISHLIKKIISHPKYLKVVFLAFKQLGRYRSK